MVKKRKHQSKSPSTPSKPSPSKSSSKPNINIKSGYKFVEIFKGYLGIALLIFSLILLWNIYHRSPYSHTIVATKNGLFGKISVVDDVKSGVPVRMLTYGSSVLGGYWGISGKPSCFTAFDVMELALYAHQGPKRALVVGLGTGIFARRAILSGVKCDVVEIDPMVVHLAWNYFGFYTRGHIYKEDALAFLERGDIMGVRAYDIIMHDIFAGDMNTTELFTTDNIRKFESILNDDGIFALNFIGRPHDKAAKVVYHSLSTIWSNVRCFADQIVNSTSNIPLNMVYFASHNPIKLIIPPHFSKEAKEYSFEWIFTHHSELELQFPPKTEEDEILNENNVDMLKFDEGMKRDFRDIMLTLFDEKAWENILENKAT